MVASCTPCDRSGTSSLVGQRVAARRRRRSAIASSGISTWKGRISVAESVMALVIALPLGYVNPARRRTAEQEGKTLNNELSVGPVARRSPLMPLASPPPLDRLPPSAGGQHPVGSLRP